MIRYRPSGKSWREVISDFAYLRDDVRDEFVEMISGLRWIRVLDFNNGRDTRTLLPKVYNADRDVDALIGVRGFQTGYSDVFGVLISRPISISRSVYARPFTHSASRLIRRPDIKIGGWNDELCSPPYTNPSYKPFYDIINNCYDADELENTCQLVDNNWRVKARIQPYKTWINDQMIKIEAPYYTNISISPGMFCNLIDIDYRSFRKMVKIINNPAPDPSLEQFQMNRRESNNNGNMWCSTLSWCGSLAHLDKFNRNLERIWRLPYPVDFTIYCFETFPGLPIDIVGTIYQQVENKIAGMRTMELQVKHSAYMALQQYLIPDICSLVRSYVI